MPRTCATMNVHHRLLSTNPEYAKARANIENGIWSRTLSSWSFSGVVTIDVVVHVVHNNNSQNISDAQINSQIDVLNRDFRSTNPDLAGIPAAFAALAADLQVEFRLIGITRTRTATPSFSDNDDVKFTSRGGHDAWSRGRFLNIWACPLGGGLLGYAQFPGGPADTDGVVVAHDAFGTLGTANAPFNLGRTATHEVGHWLNLLHIWGDDGGGCNGSDLVSDTPNQGGPNYGTPAFPTVSCNNGPNGDLFMNYMDYVDDAAMYMFSRGQSLRSRITLDGRRGKYYFFSGDKYIRVTRDETGPGMIDPGYPKSISAWNWGDFGKDGIDAALFSGQKCYFFSGDKYIRVTRGETGPGTIDPDYPKNISEWNWNGFGKNGIDAALFSGRKCYFFKGNKYIRVTRDETGPGMIDPGYPKSISAWNWGDFGKDGIDAALFSGQKCYFFSGDKYIRVTRGETGPGTIDPYYPKNISEWNWANADIRGIDAAL